jgi:four helix bundle protein
MNGETKRKFDLEERLINFSVRILNVVETMPETRSGNHIAGQLVRCGTSPASNYAEAQSAESRTDFVHKLKIALKELRETRIWLLIIQRKSLITPPKKLDPILVECDELNSIFYKSIKTAEENNKRK